MYIGQFILILALSAEAKEYANCISAKEKNSLNMGSGDSEAPEML